MGTGKHDGGLANFLVAPVLLGTRTGVPCLVSHNKRHGRTVRKDYKNINLG